MIDLYTITMNSNMLLILFGIISFACHLSSEKSIESNQVKENFFYDIEKAEELFNEFIQKYDKWYSDEAEYEYRLAVFTDNLNEVNRLNAASARRYPVFGINHLHDLSAEELEARHGGCMGAFETSGNLTAAEELIDTNVKAPKMFDWRQRNVVTPVEDQGECFSCWSFSTAGAIEGQLALRHGQLIPLSEQQLVKCNPVTNGCKKGWIMDQTFQFIEKMRGIMSSADYPYNVNDPRDCAFNSNLVVAKVTQGRQVSVQSEDQLKELLYQYGPLAIGVDARPWNRYIRGILPYAPVGEINHGVLLVGYGVENGEKFWIIKNLYGQNWGERGYVRLPRGMIGSYVATVQVV